MIDVIREAFKRAIEKKVAEKSAHLSAGKASSFENYKELAGEIRGLNAAAEIFKDVIKRHGGLDDE